MPVRIGQVRRVGLLTTLDTNIGDDFIREGLLGVIHSFPRRSPLETVAVNKHRPESIYPPWHPMRAAVAAIPKLPFGRIKSRALARRLIQRLGPTRFENCDLLIQCGTPILWIQCHRSEWAEPVWRDVLARLSVKIPLLNLGGGSCYPWEHQPETLLGNQDEEFARLMLAAATLTTVRDPLAAKLLGSLGAVPEVIACPALLAGQVFAKPTQPSRRVLVNYMPGGAHTMWGQPIDPKAWQETMREVVQALRRDWEVTLLAHSEGELAEAARLWPDLPRIHPLSPREYFAAGREAAFGIFNRLHAGVALGGLGVPSVCIGTDTRLLMVKTVGLPIHYAGRVRAADILADAARLAAERVTESQRLLALRERTFSRYREVLAPWFQEKSNLS